MVIQNQCTLPSFEKKAVIIVFLATKLISLADSLNIQKRAITSWQVLKMGEFSQIGIELL